MPHDRRAFTQGLVIDGDRLYESSGLAGWSWVRAADRDGRELARAAVPGPLFGEGIAVAHSRLWHLTWQHGIAFDRDPVTLAQRRTVRYRGEGWGLCYDRARDRLIMSDGTNTLTFRDPATFAELDRITVPGAGRLNDLTCVADAVYANVWYSDTILRIDVGTGSITARIDASSLLPSTQRKSYQILNGIAGVPGTDEFLLTGKLWPTMYRVQFIAAKGVLTDTTEQRSRGDQIA